MRLEAPASFDYPVMRETYLSLSFRNYLNKNLVPWRVHFSFKLITFEYFHDIMPVSNILNFILQSKDGMRKTSPREDRNAEALRNGKSLYNQILHKELTLRIFTYRTFYITNLYITNHFRCSDFP